MDTIHSDEYQKCFKKKYGFVKRARGSFLYTEKNIRLVDLAQNEGRAILGWRHGSSMLSFKNTLEKGLWSSYPNGSEHRLQKALSSLFSLCGYSEYTSFYWYIGNLDRHSSLKNRQSLYPWSPLYPQTDNNAVTRIKDETLLFIPPLPWPSLYILASKNNSLPSSDRLSTCLIEALTRSLYDLIKEFPKRPPESWGKFDSVLNAYFIREGSLLKPKLKGKDYDAFALHCLESEIYIAERNPEKEEAPPSFVPWFANLSAFKKL